MHWAEKYMTIPYDLEGSSFKGCNCWGLVHLVLLAEKAIKTPTYSEITGKQIRRIKRAISGAQGTPPWQHRVELGEEKPFDTIIFKGLVRGREFEMHTGIVTEQGKCIHIEKGAAVSHVPFYNSKLHKCNRILFNRFVSMFRHEELVGVT